jgi:hypothetical protein
VVQAASFYGQNNGMTIPSSRQLALSCIKIKTQAKGVYDLIHIGRNFGFD